MPGQGREAALGLHHVWLTRARSVEGVGEGLLISLGRSRPPGHVSSDGLLAQSLLRLLGGASASGRAPPAGVEMGGSWPSMGSRGHCPRRLEPQDLDTEL